MQIRLSPSDWVAVRADTNYEYVRSAFYLGYNVLHIRFVLLSAHNQQEIESVIATAKILGIREEDTVVMDPTVRP